jgi:RecG-like helicase
VNAIRQYIDAVAKLRDEWNEAVERIDEEIGRMRSVQNRCPTLDEIDLEELKDAVETAEEIKLSSSPDEIETVVPLEF